MTYDYECTDCGHVQEEIHGMNESPEIKCEKCRMPMKRLITGGTGLIFKGDFITNDSKFKKSMTDKSMKQGQKAKDHVKPLTTLSNG